MQTGDFHCVPHSIFLIWDLVQTPQASRYGLTHSFPWLSIIFVLKVQSSLHAHFSIHENSPLSFLPLRTMLQDWRVQRMLWPCWVQIITGTPEGSQQPATPAPGIQHCFLASVSMDMHVRTQRYIMKNKPYKRQGYNRCSSLMSPKSETVMVSFTLLSSFLSFLIMQIKRLNPGPCTG